MRSIIVDTGALVALFDPDDGYRAGIKASLAREPASVVMITTWPCVTEAMHILARVDQQLALLEFLRAGPCRVQSFTAADLEDFIAMIVKYRDHPVDFADVSLVWVAATLNLRAVLTTDRNDFERYRLPGNKRFQIL